ncbi:MAG: chromate resistance protein [Conexivisphaerales archaeon]
MTREKAKVDRVACPWLIKKFVDPDAQFLFVPEDKVIQVAREEGAIPFDIKGAELGHHGDECTFDAIIKKYNLDDPALKQLALVVRGADTSNRSLTPESPGLNSIAEGFRLISKNDYDNLAKQFPVYDALYAYFNSKVKKDNSK